MARKGGDAAARKLQRGAGSRKGACPRGGVASRRRTGPGLPFVASATGGAGICWGRASEMDEAVAAGAGTSEEFQTRSAETEPRRPSVCGLGRLG